jgi:GrpB-like predicted nucleotidyltransferase (UPF0157 family)
MPDPAWGKRFEEEKAVLLRGLGPWLAGPIEHIGSTAVPGLAAKPVIDIMAAVQSLDASRPAIAAVEALDYCYAPYRTDREHWFCKPSFRERTHHLHLVPLGARSGSRRSHFAMSSDRNRRSRPSTRRSSAAWRQSSATIAKPTRMPRDRSSHRLSAVLWVTAHHPWQNRDPTNARPPSGATPSGPDDRGAGADVRSRSPSTPPVPPALTALLSAQGITQRVTAWCQGEFRD